MLKLDIRKQRKTTLVGATVGIAVIAITAGIMVFLGVAKPQEVNAVSSSDWIAGHIIDDSLFFDNKDMSVQDVQTFLNNKVPNCDTNGTQIYSGSMTDAQYASTQGWPGPPYVCLKDYYQVPRSDQDINNLTTNTIPSGAISAAQIIKNAADTYGISVRALLVTLQKESLNLLQDNWPLPSQYHNPMSYGCPDGGVPCDPQYEGFYNQVTNAARQFKLYANNPSAYRYKANQNNLISYNPTSSCGSSSVYIDNQATAGLYNYTPYQPNQAALNNLYGFGDDCSAYGNRNFWRLFNDWFGPTKIAYHWQPVEQKTYTSSDTATTLDLSNVVSGSVKRAYVTIKMQNNGNVTWYKNAVNLGTSQPQNRNSILYDSSWLSQNRPATLNEDHVAPGEYGTFSFWITVPTTPGAYKEYFNMVAEGITWMNDVGLYFQVGVQPAHYEWSPVSQQAYLDSTKQRQANITNMGVGDRDYMVVKVLNTGNITWYKNAVNLATNGPQNRTSAFYDPSWLSSNRPATLSEQSVAPGAVGTFEFWTHASSPGNFKEYFNLVAENVSWFNDLGLYYGYGVKDQSYTWQPVSQSAYTDATKATPVDLNNVSPGQKIYLEIKARNVGNSQWRKGIVNLATNGPQNRTSAFYDPSWLSINRPTTLNEDFVMPQEIGSFDFWVDSPTTLGAKKEYFNFVAENISWFNDLGLYYGFTIK